MIIITLERQEISFTEARDAQEWSCFLLKAFLYIFTCMCRYPCVGDLVHCPRPIVYTTIRNLLFSCTCKKTCLIVPSTSPDLMYSKPECSFGTEEEIYMTVLLPIKNNCGEYVSCLDHVSSKYWESSRAWHPQNDFTLVYL